MLFCPLQCPVHLKATMHSLWKLLDVTPHRVVPGPGDDVHDPYVAVDIAGSENSVAWAEFANAAM